MNIKHALYEVCLFDRSLWAKESELSSEIDQLKQEVIKAEKSLDHATPGVSNCFRYQFVMCNCGHCAPKTELLKQEDLEGHCLNKEKITIYMSIAEGILFMFPTGGSHVIYLTDFTRICQDIRRGLNSVRRICRQSEISGVCGPIFELLDCDEKFFTAVEVTAGNR